MFFFILIPILCKELGKSINEASILISFIIQNILFIIIQKGISERQLFMNYVN